MHVFVAGSIVTAVLLMLSKQGQVVGRPRGRRRLPKYVDPTT